MVEQLNEILNNKCTICLKENLNDEEIYYTNCNHEFCKSCLDDWFQRGNQSCPLCRSEITEYKYKDEKYKLVIYNSNENIINENIDESRVIENISDINIIYNTIVKKLARLRLVFFITSMSFLFLFNSHINLMTNYNELREKYDECINNNLNISSYLNDCFSNIPPNPMNHGYYVSMYNGEITRRCFYPLNFYNICFNK